MRWNPHLDSDETTPFNSLNITYGCLRMLKGKIKNNP